MILTAYRIFTGLSRPQTAFLPLRSWRERLWSVMSLPVSCQEPVTDLREIACPNTSETCTKTNRPILRKTQNATIVCTEPSKQTSKLNPSGTYVQIAIFCAYSALFGNWWQASVGDRKNVYYGPSLSMTHTKMVTSTGLHQHANSAQQTILDKPVPRLAGPVNDFETGTARGCYTSLSWDLPRLRTRAWRSRGGCC